jgi:Trpc4-associated protein
MASCIEAFLRGSEPIFQKFVAKSGMLEYLVDDIVADGPKVQGSLQTSFDLLGELVKFNREIFSSFNQLLTGEKLPKFLSNVITHLVDSNVFLRGMVLSMERFTEEDRTKSGTPGHTPYAFAECKIAQFLDQNWFRLVKDLMTVVSIDNINQENICCVNTTMVFCIYARRKGHLRSFIQDIRVEEESYRVGRMSVPPIFVTANFQKLLWFWHEYYLLRGKDCLSLEYTSQISFGEWTSTYEVLVEELGEFDPSSLYEEWREREQKAKKDKAATSS